MPANPTNGIGELKMGPFAGGLNQYSDQSAIADNELADCVNFDLDLDGSLKSRPPWRILWSTSQANTLATLSPSFQQFLGSVTYAGNRLIFYYWENEGYSGAYLYYLDGPKKGDTKILGFGNFSRMVRYNDIVYIIPDVTNTDNTGIKYTLSTDVTSTLALEQGYSALIYKDRLWITGRRGIVNSSRLYFSDPGNPESFPSTNFFDINPGDGDATQDLAVYQDNLCIFKDSATYVLSFDSNPAEAVLQLVNTDIGVAGPRCIIPYENSIFILQYNEVYEMVNYDFTRVSVKVPFEYDATVPDSVDGYAWRDPIWMSRIGDRLIVRFYNRLYIYHLRLRAWTRWDSTDTNIKYIGYIGMIDNTNTGLRLGYNSYVAGTSLNSQYDSSNQTNTSISTWEVWNKFYIIDDRYEGSFVENGDTAATSSPIQCMILTKSYDLGLSQRFKRLMHWGVDVITGKPITGTVYPFSVAYRVLWSQLHQCHWHDLNEWGYPLFSIPMTSQSEPDGSGMSRRYIRFPRSLRFRLVQFRIDMETSGNTIDGPARLYSLTAFIGAKQLVPKAVN